MVSDTGSKRRVAPAWSASVSAVAQSQSPGSTTLGVTVMSSGRTPAGYMSTWFQLSTSRRGVLDAPLEKPSALGGST
jgi:hypothetical protein